MSEHQEQCAVFDWARRAQGKYPDIALLYAVPNAGGYTGGFKKNAGRVVSMLREGVQKGVPDICLPVARGPYIGLYIEMKYGRNKPSDEQKDWMHRLQKAGHYVTVEWNAEKAINVLKWYLEGADVGLVKKF